MTTPAEKLGDALEALHTLQKRGMVAINTKEISTTYRQRLVKNGFLKEVLKGWYIPASPEERPGDSTYWYANYWNFCGSYINFRYRHQYILSPEQSLQLHSGNQTVPAQLVVKAPDAANFKTDLPFHTSLFHMRGELPTEELRDTQIGIIVYNLPASLVYSSSSIFADNPMDARAALALIRDSSEVLSILLNGGHSTIAGRLCGAFRNIGRDRIADDVLKSMKAAGHDVRERDPFETKVDVNLSFRDSSPYANRIRLMWNNMRDKVIKVFPPEPGIPQNKAAYIQAVEDVYVTDAYHSLSIERYRVAPELIEKVRSGEWNSEGNENDRRQRDAMAARGYWQAFQVVKDSIHKILNGENSGTVADEEHQDWYRELFAPSVTAGILKVGDLAGYRTNQVYIGGSKHVPLNVTALRDAMPLLFELLAGEPEASVRTVLGHFVLVNIHPYMDGNGRMGRFMMNVMLSSGGYPWTVIPVERRVEYMSSLEVASVDGDIGPFAKFIAELVQLGINGKPAATLENANL
ncbi:Fic family protein [Mucilaginibacter sp. UYCu711]|uniref:Fic family protein n=1 Tax=Mucilaginibacter sp. UYCu711 TaxID=3156339 RepID=UPI003D204FD2